MRDTTRYDAPPRLAILGVGLAASVGSSALAAVAALRAGVARYHEVPDMQLLGRAGVAAEPAVAARSPLRAGATNARDIEDVLLTRVRADAAGWCPAEGWETVRGTDVALGELRHTPLLDAVIRHAERPGAVVAPLGLAAVESVSSTSALAHFADLGRLKGSATPSGFVAGEAGAAVIVASEAAARQAGYPVLATVEAWGRGHEPVPLGGAVPSRADGLTTALSSAFPDDAEAPDLTVIDLNGERARALEWGLASPRALPRWHGRLAVWTPAEGVGECGVAAAGIGLVCAVLALARGEAETALVVASDDHGGRVAVRLRAAARIG